MANEIVAAVLLILLEAFFLHLASKILAPKPSFVRAILTALVGGVIAALILQYVPGVLGLVLAVVVWGFVAGAFYRIGWLRAILLGLTAGILYLLARWLMLELLDVLRKPEGRP